MKRRVSLVGMFACAVCLVMTLAGCSQGTAYTPETLNPTVSSPTIGKEGTLRVGVGGGAPFLVSTNSGNAASGLDVDMAAALANQLGLKLEVVSLGTGEVDVKSALAKGDVDIVMSATSSDKGDSVWVSDPYTQTGIALFASPGTAAPTKGGATKIAAQSSSTSAWAVTNAFGEEALVANSDLLSALSSVETKGATYVAADAVIGSYAALGQNVDVEPVAVLGTVGGYGVAVSAENVDLQKAVADALKAITGNGVADVVCSKWLGASIDLSALPLVEVSTSKSASVKADDSDSDDSSSEEKTGGNESAVEENSSDSADDGVEPKTEAGANAVLPQAAPAAA